MESFIGLILVILIVSSLIFFRRMIKKSSNYVEDVVTTSVSEAQIDLVKRSTVAYTKLIDECGEDFMTPQEIYEKMQRKTHKEEPSKNKKK